MSIENADSQPGEKKAGSKFALLLLCLFVGLILFWGGFRLFRKAGYIFDLIMSMMN